MSVSLVKGQKVNLTKEAGGSLTKLLIGLGWDGKDPNVAGAEFDLDASIFAVNAAEKALSDKYFVYYGNLQSPEGAIVHQGDNLTGAGEGDDEQIIVDVTKLPPEAEKLVVAVTIYEAAERKQNFGNVRHCRPPSCSGNWSSVTATGISAPTAPSSPAAWRACAASTGSTSADRPVRGLLI